jgi:hypothetical protein
MNFILQRYSDNRKSTLGLLFKKIMSGTEEKLSLQAYTLEDEYREDKVMSETRIPAGFYELGIQQIETPMTKKYQAKYDWFKKHIEIKNVPNFVGVYIHIGNSDADTAGCVLLGDQADNNSIGDGAIMQSTAAFRRFYGIVYDHLAAGGKAHIEIRDESALIRI